MSMVPANIRSQGIALCLDTNIPSTSRISEQLSAIAIVISRGNYQQVQKLICQYYHFIPKEEYVYLDVFSATLEYLRTRDYCKLFYDCNNMLKKYPLILDSTIWAEYSLLLSYAFWEHNQILTSQSFLRNLVYATNGYNEDCPINGYDEYSSNLREMYVNMLILLGYYRGNVNKMVFKFTL